MSITDQLTGTIPVITMAGVTNIYAKSMLGGPKKKRKKGKKSKKGFGTPF